eukprot:TRINITY_DN2991_c0_g1_i4.p1 TRINITY_DN2991_c0_g1~~TRINITY_DN2991_c0_g1_i4.p1  ORF type:complete len:188 (-),score=46.69 TRINITY_DN2991_c0_g1_i4:161-724(-)
MANRSDDPHFPFSQLCSDANELFISSECAVIHEKPTPLQFMRDYVATNTPVLIKGGASHWSAVSKWTNNYLRRIAGDLDITVDATPNGYGDNIVETEDGLRFVKPEERRVKFAAFIDALERYRSIVDDELDDDVDEVVYAQHQNSSFLTEFQPLWNDVDAEIDFASQAFNAAPEAVNFWYVLFERFS